MGWVGLWDEEDSVFNPSGFAAESADHATSSLVTRGSIVLETQFTPGRRPQILLRYESGGSWPVQLSIQSIPGGGATFVLDQAGHLAHAAVSQPHTGRLEVLRITYSWDAPQKWGRLAMEHVDTGRFTIANVEAPPPLRHHDLEALICGMNTRFVSPDAVFLAVSTDIEPVGPMPSIGAMTPVETPSGEVPIAQLRRGDTIITDTGDTVPVLYRLSRTVPARGAFAPVRLRSPYFGLRQDAVVSPLQRLKISGSIVDYMFGTEAVLANASHLTGGIVASNIDNGPFITYHQVLLPRHETMLAAGAELESLFIGRLRRKKNLLAATLLQGHDRNKLPEHPGPAFPVLRQYDALVLAEQRSA